MGKNSKTHRILVADDEESILDAYQQVLSPQESGHDPFADLSNLAESLFDTGKEKDKGGGGAGFEIVTCRQGDEALETVKRAVSEKRPFSVAFLDVRMPPGPDGVWTAEKIREFDPHIEIVMVTGYSDTTPDAMSRRILPPHKLLYIQKPFHPQELSHFAASLGAKWKSEFELKGAYERLNAANMDLQNQIRERKKIEESLRKSEERYRIVLDFSPDPISVFDIEGRPTYINPAFSEVFGWTLEEFREGESGFIPPDRITEARIINEKIRLGEQVSCIETIRFNKDGKKVHVSISGAIFPDPGGGLKGSIITIQNITRRKESEEEVRFLAYHDSLTGLPNRKSFYQKLEDELARYQVPSQVERRRNASKGALLFLDLDKFKQINDTLGHDVGDQLLKLVSDRVRNCLRKNDFVFRLGGDEFTIILQNVIDEADLAGVAEKIRSAAGKPYTIGGHEIQVNFSIGITVFPDDAVDVETLVKYADMAMYLAKEEGDGFYFYTEEVYRKALERMRMESALRRALENHEFRVYYQPLVDSCSRLIGIEALIRWHHPEMGMVSPAEFIPIAEETGIIVPIGKWVLSAVCGQIAEWEKKGYTGFDVAVNVSPRQFKDPELIEAIEGLLTHNGVSPDRLKLEMTETCVMANPDEAVVKMEALSRRGIRIAIDDFGTGYSSLSYLKRFPIDILKIDRSFVAEAETSKDDREIIRTIIAMARNMNIETVAEGVETEGQKNLLLDYGCQILQGFYFGVPMPSGRLEDEFLSRR